MDQDPTATKPGFAQEHPWDRNFFLVYLLIIWAVIATGFGIDMATRENGKFLSYPLIVHFHAVVYVGWLALFTTQILLIRKGDYTTHMRTGLAALVLLPLMAVLGPATAIVMDRLRYDPASTHVAFMATQFTNVLGCIVLICCGLLWRRDPSAHKRLMLMGTLAVTEPGFSRIWRSLLHGILGNGFFPYLAETYIGTIVLMLGLGAYDLVTRKRLHPAYVAAFFWVLANEMTAAWLFFQPWWLAFCRHLVGH